MNIRIALIAFILLLFTFPSLGQNCDLILKGKVVDKITMEAIPFVSVLHLESGQGSISEPDGVFHFHDRCPGKQTLIIMHVGYARDTIHLVLPLDRTLVIQLEAKVEWLESVEIEGDYHAHDQRYIGGSVEKKSISIQSNKNMADMLESIEGVYVLKTGVGVSKPIIHGMYGNRVTTINRGITQSGQHWGNDHGPEIDAFGADQIKVIKGAGALAYDGNSLGNIVLVESRPIANDSVIHGEVNSVFQSNGLGGTLNASLEKSSKWASWRVIASVKRMGDSKAADYYLTNTGKSEQNLSFQLNKSFSSKWYNEIYLSTFNTEIGILRGSHMGNVTDLEEAIGRDVPFFTEEEFSYDINPPRQEVRHHLIKYEAKYFTKPFSFISFKYGGQWDSRKEYDVRRGDRSDIPALDLSMITHSFDLAYQHHFNSGHTLNTAYQYSTIDNTNDPETGVLPLIPDYLSWSHSLYAIIEKDKEKWGYDFGLRYNHRSFNVVTITRDIPRTIERFDNDYDNIAVSGSLKYVWKPGWTAKLNASFAQRSPEVNELYSNGLHQGVAAIEEGNPDLISETSFKTLASVDWNKHEKWHIQVVAYIQPVENYIFLEPQEEYRLTIRGAYPIYRYKQTNALIYGSDFSLDYSISKKIQLRFGYAIVRGENKSEDLTLINMPSDRVKLDLSYHFMETEKWSGGLLSLNSSYTFKQTRITEEQDFMLPPDAYFLLGLNGGIQRYYSKMILGFNLRIENMLNVSYRDYLNRMRYYADDVGINIQLGVRLTF